MTKLAIANGLDLPLDAVTQKLAFMGRTGSGKTYGASKLVEQMLEASAQVVVLDPVGAWHGLRLPGTGRGFEIPVLGGLHGDISLESTAGAVVAELVAGRAISAVLDVSQMTSAEQARFATDFATRFFALRKAAPSAVHLVLEECQEFVPQNAQPGEQRMLHAFERLVKLGRNFGIGVSLISQRPQEVNKKALNQTECLFAFQMTGPQERKALATWTSERGVESSLVDALPGLRPGQCFVWSPSWLQVSKQVEILPKRSADASSTPNVGAAARPTQALTPIDLQRLLGDVAETIERAQADDTTALKKRIAELEKQVATRAPPAPTFTEAEWAKLEAVGEGWKHVAADTARAAEVFSRFILALDRVAPPARDGERRGVAQRDVKPDNVVHRDPKPEKASRPGPAPKATGGTADVRAGARHILAVATRHHPQRLSRDVLAARSGMASSGGTYATYIGDLKRAGYLADDLSVTERGIAHAGVKPRTPMSRDEVIAQWAKLRSGARNMLAQVIEHGALGRDELARAVGMEASGGTFATYIGDLRRPGLITSDRGRIALGPALEGTR